MTCHGRVIDTWYNEIVMNWVGSWTYCGTDKTFGTDKIMERWTKCWNGLYDHFCVKIRCFSSILGCKYVFQRKIDAKAPLSDQSTNFFVCQEKNETCFETKISQKSHENGDFLAIVPSFCPLFQLNVRSTICPRP